MINTIMPDESLQSYILRNLLAAGLVNTHKKIKGIISNTGYLRTDIQLTKEQKNLFYDIPDVTLIHYINSHMPMIGEPAYRHPKATVAFFSSLFRYKELSIRCFKKPVGNVHFSTIHLRYCPYCFEKQILTHGFTWLKLEWMFSSECRDHQFTLQPMTEYPCECSLSLSEKAFSLFTGKCCNCKKDFWHFEKKTERSNYEQVGSEKFARYGSKGISFDPASSNSIHKPSSTKVIPFSLCLIKDFEQLLYNLNVPKKFNPQIDNSKNPDLPYALLLDPLVKYDKKDNCYKLVVLDEEQLFFRLNSAIHDKEPEIKEFLDANLETLILDCDDLGVEKIFVKYMVSKNRNCKKCPALPCDCPLKIDAKTN